MLQGDSEQMLSNGQSTEGGPKNPATAALEAAKAVNAGQPAEEEPSGSKTSGSKA